MSDEQNQLKDAVAPPALKKVEDSQGPAIKTALVNDDERTESAVSAESLRESQAARPYKRTMASASFSELLSSSTQDCVLEKIAMHPNASEEEWMHACNVLRARDNILPKSKSRRTARLMILSFLGSVIATGFLFAGIQHFHTEQAVPYVISNADWHNKELKQRLLIQIAQNIQRRGWTEERASKFLNVEKARISALMNGQSLDFSADQLNRMAFALGVKMQFPDSETAIELQDAVEYYTRALELQPNNARALSNRADAYDKQKKFDLEIADLNQYMKVRPDRVGGLWSALSPTEMLVNTSWPWLISMKFSAAFLRRRTSIKIARSSSCQ